MNIRRKIIITLSFVIAIMLVIGFSYAKFVKMEVQGNNNYNVIVGNTISGSELTPNFVVTYDEGDNIIDIDRIAPSYQDLIKFKVSTSYQESQEIIIQLGALLNVTNGNYNLYSCDQTSYNNATYANVSSNCTRISVANDSLPIAGVVKQIHTTTSLTLSANGTNYYALTIDALQTFNNFRGYVLVESYKETTLVNKILTAHPPVSDATSSTYVSSGSGINFSAVNSPTNGQGLYINNKVNIAGDPTQGTIKYFRGGTYCAYTNYATETDTGTRCIAAGGTWTDYHCSLSDSQSACTGAGGAYYELKNNVMFAGFAWRIIRINGDNSIRLIYNGTGTTARGLNASIGVRAFNGSKDSSQYVGYVYGTTSSTVKGFVDTWYNTNLSSYANKLTDAGFCGDRSGTTSAYGAYTRLYTSKTPTFNCPDMSNDLYTLTTNGIGNKKLTYPIGLITTDELAYAGGVYGIKNFTYYLQNSSFSSSYGYYWTMSPYSYNNGYGGDYVAYVWNVGKTGSYSGGNINDNGVAHYSGMARPVINLKADVLISSGTGTLTDPWVIQ